jgi:glycine/D-amino acid oxidase-like deaminating enzyme
VAGEIIRGDRIILSAGAWSRKLLQQSGISLPLYFSHAEMIELPKAVLEQANLRMQRLVMPAEQVRFGLEAEASQPEFASRWREVESPEPEPTEQDLMPPALDAGIIQFLDGRGAMGQISRLQPHWQTRVDPSQSEAAMRQKLGGILPAIAPLPGQWHSTRVAFSGDGLPLIGPVPGWDNLHLFSGFSSPFVYAVPLAERFADCLVQLDDLAADPWLGQMLPSRFGTVESL